MLHDVLGTRSSMAPEISALESYQGRPVDIYALGVILFFMHSGHRPFEQSSMDDYRFKVFHEKNHLFWKFREKSRITPFSSEFKELINGMLAMDPEHRPTID